MIVATYRDNETPRPHPLHRLRSEARGAACAQSLSLRTLSVDDLHELTEALREIPDLAPANLLAVSGGNPLFLTQFIDDVRKGSQIAPTRELTGACVGANRPALRGGAHRCGNRRLHRNADSRTTHFAT